MLLIIVFTFHKIYAGNLSKNPHTQPVVKQFINHKDWNFVENKGQIKSPESDPTYSGGGLAGVKYYGRQGGVNIYCKPGMISFVFTKQEGKDDDAISEATGMPAPYPLKGGRSLSAIGRTKSTALVPTYSGGDLGAGLGKIITNRADLVLLNSNPSAEIIASDQQEYYENFYTTGNADSGITNVHTYKTITYKSIYPGIDLILRSREEGMKYEFVVYPGGKVSDIQLQWNGLENIKNLKNSGIEYSLALGTLSESAPYTFVRAAPCVRPECEEGPGCEKGYGIGADTRVRPYGSASEEIASSFILKNNRVGFKVDRYDKSKILVIDPTLIWGTYFGGSGSDYGRAIATDHSGNEYIMGYSYGTSGITTTAGAYQTFMVGDSDADDFNIFIAKFNDAGRLLWSTYYGGIFNVGTCISIDDRNSVYIGGWTRSPSGIATSGGFQSNLKITPFGIDFNAFLAKFDSLGRIEWATYYGANSFAFGVATDHSGNVYLGGVTSDTADIATKGAFKTNIKYKDTAAFIVKFNRNGARQWATYFGDSVLYGGFYDNSFDNIGLYGYGNLTADNKGNIYLAGVTAASSGIATNGAYQTSFSGGTHKTLYGGGDAFLAKLDSAGKLQWATYFGGNGNETCDDVATDSYGNVYITGNTQSFYGIATRGAYQNSTQGDDAYLAKFNGSGSLLWATYYGGDFLTEASGVATDGANNVYITGLTSCPKGIATSNAYQLHIKGSESSFLAEFNNAGAIQWATYYGGTGTDKGTDVATDAVGNIYITGITSSGTDIATNGAYQTSYGGGGNDAFLAKFYNKLVVNDAGIDSVISPSGNYCQDTLPVTVQLKNYSRNELDSVKIGFSINKKNQPPYFWAGQLDSDSIINISIGNIVFPVGADTLKTWAYSPNGGIDSLPGNDTTIVIINSYPLPNASAGPDTTLCYNETYIMKGSGGITYSWTPSNYLSSASDPHAIAALPNTELYTLLVTNAHGCKDSSQVLLKVRPKLGVKIIADSIYCYGTTITMHTNASGGDNLHYSFLWPLDGNQKGDSLSETAMSSGWHKIALSDNCSPTQATDSVYITVVPLAKSLFTWVPDTPLTKLPVTFQNLSSNALSYLWEFGNKDTSTKESPTYVYKDSGEYKIKLISFGFDHCPNDTASRIINIINKLIVIYVPNTFTPNNDGINNYFIISGTGIKSYSYNIYNRWGEHIFSANSGVSPLGGNQGAGGGTAAWDGTFKGMPAPESIYIYQLEVIDIEGLHHFLSGNITLMR